MNASITTIKSTWSYVYKTKVLQNVTVSFYIKKENLNNIGNIMQQFISVKAYQEATPIQLVGHLISEIKAIKNDKKLLEYLDFKHFHQKNECGTHYCLAGYMALRSGILIKDEHTVYLTKDFLAIFSRVDGYYSKALCPSTDRDKIDTTWNSIFGVTSAGGTLEDRLVRAEKILENLKQKEK